MNMICFIKVVSKYSKTLSSKILIMKGYDKMKNAKKLLCMLSAAAMLSGCTGGEDVRTVSDLDKPEITYVSEAVEPNYSVDEISGEFEYALLKEIATREKNTVVSPLSVKLALNMAALGAKNDTEKELLTMFGYENREQMREESQNIISELDREDGSIIVSNSVWVAENYGIGKNYTSGLQNVFNAEMFRENLTSKNIVKKLNDWINSKTNGLIPDMINEPFGDDMGALLVNALYFKNDWDIEFDPADNIINMPFHGVNGDSRVDGMYLLREDIYYGEGEYFRSVSLGYKDGSNMNIYLPTAEGENVLDIIDSLSADELSKAMTIGYSNGLKEGRTVKLVLPKFECEYNESIKPILQRLGMTCSFDSGSADFGGMLDMDTYNGLYISDVIHAAKLECNEKGTEAAAATIVTFAVTMAVPNKEPEPIEFIADRPFIYEIKAPNGEIMFMGVISSF